MAIDYPSRIELHPNKCDCGKYFLTATKTDIIRLKDEILFQYPCMFDSAEQAVDYAKDMLLTHKQSIEN